MCIYCNIAQKTGPPKGIWGHLKNKLIWHTCFANLVDTLKNNLIHIEEIVGTYKEVWWLSIDSKPIRKTIQKRQEYALRGKD